MAGYSDGVEVRASDNSPLQLIKGQDRYIKALPLDDGRLSFAVDSKKIYLDCDFTDPHGTTYGDRMAFGGTGGIYYGMRTFEESEIEESNYVFLFPDQFDSASDLEVPSVDDLILNRDGCFYRVVRVTENETEGDSYDIKANKLTVAGGGGGGGGEATGVRAELGDFKRTAIASTRQIPVVFKVTDSRTNSHIDVDVTINDIYAGSFNDVVQDEFVTINLYKYLSYFVMNDTNKIYLRWYNEHGEATAVTIKNFRVINLELKAVETNLGIVYTDSVNISFKPFGASKMYDRFINISMDVPQTANDVEIREPYSAQIDDGELFVYTITGLRNQGTYNLRAWISAHAEEDGEELTSEPLNLSFVYQNIDSSTPTLQVVLAERQFKRGDVAAVEYRVAYNGASHATVRLETWFNNALLSSTGATVTTLDAHVYRTTLRTEGNYKFVVAVDAYGLEETIDGVIVTAEESSVPHIDTEDSSLQLYLSSQDRSNDDDNREIWEYNDIRCSFENFNWASNGWIPDEDGNTCLRLTNGAKLTIPFAPFSYANTGGGAQRTGKTLEFVFKVRNVRDENGIIIQAASWDNNGKLTTGIVSTGTKFTMNTNGLTNFMSSEEEANLTEKERESYNLRNGLRAYLAEDTRIHVAYAIQSTADNRLIYTYVNGVISGLVQYASTDSILDMGVNPSNIVVDSRYADIDLYAIRVYSKYLGDSLMLNNYAADLPTDEERVAAGLNNDALNNGEISLKKVQELGNIPYIVFTDLRETGSKKGVIGTDETTGKDIIGPRGTTAQLPITKEDFRWAPCYFVDPEDAKHVSSTDASGKPVYEDGYIPRSFGGPNAEELVPTVIYAQGTSSLAYPVKNLRMRFVNKSDKYSLRPAIPIDGLDSKDTAVHEAALAEWNKWENIPAVALFTLKADYMESSLSHNTGTGNVLSALYSDAEIKNAAQKKYPDRTLINNVVGFPCIAFWRTGDSIDSATYIGRYNFNLDKDSKDDAAVFGFVPSKDDKFGVLVDNEGNLKSGFFATLDEDWDASKTYYTEPEYVDGVPNPLKVYTGGESGWSAQIMLNGPLYEYGAGPSTIQCWEFLNNTDSLAGFRSDYDEEADTETWLKTSKGKTKRYGKAKWCGVYESRYPVYANECCSDKRAFKRLIAWLHSTDQNYATNDPLDPPQYGYSEDSRAYRLAKFKNEFTTYMDLPFTTFYYIITEALLMADSRGKNMMLCSFDIDSDAGTGHWYPIFYDMDTILGVDNSGILRFPYDVSDETEQGIYNAGANYGFTDNQGVYHANASYSTLWANFREAFQEEISGMYNRLRSRGKFSPAYLTECYNKKQADAFAEIYDNKDTWYKYVRPLTEAVDYFNDDGEQVHETIDKTPAAQGTRSLHRKYFLTHRFAYLDSKYAKGTNEDIEIHPNGANTTTHIHPMPEENRFFRPISQSTQYISVRLENSGTLMTSALQPNVRGTTYQYDSTYNFNDAKFYIYDLNDVYDMGDFSNKFCKVITIKHLTKLRNLKLGQADWIDPVTGETKTYLTENLTFSGLVNCPLLETLDIQNVPFNDASISLIASDLSALPYLNTLLATGSNITTVNVASGGSMQHMELPNSVTTLIIPNNLLYDTIHEPNNLKIANYASLTIVNINGCPNVDTYSLVENARLAGAAFSAFRLTDVQWDITEVSDANAELTVSNGITVLSDLKILQFLANVNYGLTSDTTANDVIPHADRNNTYFTGTITIHNDDFMVDDVNLQQTYGAQFPDLKFRYTNADNIVAAYNINVYNPATGSKLLDRSVTLDSTVAIGYNLQAYLESMGAIPYDSSDAYDYHFKGWSDVRRSSAASDSDAQIAAWLTIPMEQDPDTLGWSAPNAKTALTQEDYINNAIDLYPIYKMTRRKYLVQYASSLEGQTPVIVHEEKWIEYDHLLTEEDLPTDMPAIFNFDPDGDGDVSKTTIQQVIKYGYSNKDYDTIYVTGTLILYPQYSDPIPMNELREPVNSYFTVESCIMPGLMTGDSTTAQTFEDPDSHERIPLSEGIVLTIQPNVTAQAICVPRQINGQWVVSIRNRSKNLRRLYFEEGCPIRYIVGNAGFNGSVYDTALSSTPAAERYSQTLDNNNNIIYVADPEGTYKRSYVGLVEESPNYQLEYVDLAALTQLQLLGGPEPTESTVSTTYNGSDTTSRIFTSCPNLHISGLPDSLMIISKYTFANDSSLTFDKLPRLTMVIEERAFDNCTSLGEIQFNNAEWQGNNAIRSACLTHNSTSTDPLTQWPVIGKNAFSNCANLKFYDVIREIDGTTTTINGTRLSGPNTIGSSAFADCKVLRWNLDNEDNATIVGIADNAFNGCKAIYLAKLPKNIVTIGGGAFGRCGTIGLLRIPMSLRTMGDYVFDNTVIDNDNVSSLTWEISQAGTMSDEYTISDVCFDGMKLGIPGDQVKGPNAKLYLQVQDVDAASINMNIFTLNPWAMARTGAGQRNGALAFGLKRNNNTAPQIDLRDSNSNTIEMPPEP